MSSLIEWRTCRYCGEEADYGALHQYGTRHYAHFECWLRKHGAEAWEKLHKWQRGRFPLRVLNAFGIDYTKRLS